MASGAGLNNSMNSSLADEIALSPGPAGRNSLMTIRPCSNPSAGAAGRTGGDIVSCTVPDDPVSVITVSGCSTGSVRWLCPWDTQRMNEMKNDTRTHEHFIVFSVTIEKYDPSED
jgi:hypothetical protein